MAINWCFNEPWKTAANNSLLSYPALPRKAYYAVARSLQNTVPSARLKKFSYESGELFSAEIWLLNDSFRTVEQEEIRVSLQMGERVFDLLTWTVDFCDKDTNLQGHVVQFDLPKAKGIEKFTLRLQSEKYGENSYDLHYRYKEKAPVAEIPVLNL